ncbi:MAG: hypothetical protein FJ125_16685, partial [Deltaproteobacteria bacterium]|nr:hypothetical protein [Deltaproteobacteria bacterium]
MSATMLPWLLATLALLFAAWLAAPGRLLRTRGYQAARERWLPPAAALVGLAILAVALRDAPPWSARAVLGLLSLCTAAPPLAWAALRLGRRPPGVAGAASAAGAAALPPGGSSGLAGALLLAAAGSLAAACAPHTLPPPGGGLPPALAPAALLLVFGSGGLALGLLVATLSGLVAAGKKVRPGRQSEAALAAGAALLLVAALPGLGGSTLGAGFGLPVITAISGEGPATPLADPAGWPGGSGSASAEPSPLLGEVVAALPSGEEQPVLLPLDAHRLLLRLPVPGMQEALALAALLLGLAMLLALLPLLVPGLLPGSTAASAAMAGRRGEKRSLRWETVAAGICLSAGCGLLLLVVPGSLLAGLLPAAPFPGGEFVA